MNIIRLCLRITKCKTNKYIIDENNQFIIVGAIVCFYNM